LFASTLLCNSSWGNLFKDLWCLLFPNKSSGGINVQRKFILKSKGYYSLKIPQIIDEVPGIYCIFDCNCDSTAKCTPRSLLYIGKADNIQQRIANHERKSDWDKACKSGRPCLALAVIKDKTEREICEAAMIFKHKPRLNEKYATECPYHEITIQITGCTECLCTHFSV